MFEWVTGNAQLQVVTLNENNITLNQNAASHFQESRYVLVGFDEDVVGIKPVTKRDLDLGVYPSENLHKLTLGKGYAKINNKALCDLIADKLAVPLNGMKLIARFDEQDSVLVFDLATIKEGSD